jgi:hypothetical protein
LLFVLFYVFFVCKSVLPQGDNPIAVNKYIIYHIILYFGTKQTTEFGPLPLREWKKFRLLSNRMTWISRCYNSPKYHKHFCCTLIVNVLPSNLLRS